MVFENRAFIIDFEKCPILSKISFEGLMEISMVPCEIYVFSDFSEGENQIFGLAKVTSKWGWKWFAPWFRPSKWRWPWLGFEAVLTQQKSSDENQNQHVFFRNLFPCNCNTISKWDSDRVWTCHDRWPTYHNHAVTYEKDVTSQYC